MELRQAITDIKTEYPTVEIIYESDDETIYYIKQDITLLYELCKEYPDLLELLEELKKPELSDKLKSFLENERR